MFVCFFVVILLWVFIFLIIIILFLILIISRSSQCPTTGVTKAVVCIILPVG